MNFHNRTRKAVPSLATFLPNSIAQCLFPRVRATWTDDPGPSEDLQTGECLTQEFDCPRSLCQSESTANKLTDDALLDIFDFYLNDKGPQDIHKWHTLVHVCRRWRDIVFASPRRLNLRLLCDRDTPSWAMLDIWPALPIEIHDNWTRRCPMGPDNIIAALEHPDRVCSIQLHEFPSSVGELLAVEMQVPFPELTRLELWSSASDISALPDSFLGGSAPRLRRFQLMGIPFPELPNLLLSATDLVDLTLWLLPYLGYISPGSMAASLSSLNRLKSLTLGFGSPRALPDQPSPPPQTRVVLPALTNLSFSGMIGYSEDFLARIDTPVLDKFSMTFYQELNYEFPHLKQFIGRAKGLRPPKAARLLFYSSGIRLELDGPHGPMLKILCRGVDRQVDKMARVCRQLSPFFSLIERLDLVWDYPPLESQEEDGIVSAQFLALLQPFTAVRSLRVPRSLVPFIATALQGLIGPRATEVLPHLHDIFLGSVIVPEAIRPFVDARRLSGHPIVICHWGG
ncbi:hypothetical protein BC826DRAFT_710132 [Russula brevipes]|nr:hypothetical protein BC826DRAFT_710132 [Russula brevipes]